MIEEGAETLKKLAAKVDTGKMKASPFLLVVCEKVPFAYKRPDGIYFAPITSLRP